MNVSAAHELAVKRQALQRIVNLAIAAADADDFADTVSAFYFSIFQRGYVPGESLPTLVDGLTN